MKEFAHTNIKKVVVQKVSLWGAGNRLLFKCRSGTYGLMLELVTQARWSVPFMGKCEGADVFGSVSLCIL